MSQKIDHLNKSRKEAINIGKNSIFISNKRTIENDIKGLTPKQLFINKES
jgi:hypothetical protein